MRGRFAIPLLLAGLLLAASAVSAAAQAVSFGVFHDRLARAGTWRHDARWGDVWIPGGVGPHFRPYFDRGHWAFTDEYGWTWVPDDEWGDVVFHYGRWVFDPMEGWIWIPGYVWGPAWVDWRYGDGYVGWMPAPPDAAFLGGIGIGLTVGNWDLNFYGYRDWYGGAVGPADLWFFVGGGHFADVGFQRYALPPAQAATLIVRTRDVTEYRTVNGFVVNRSFGVREIAHLAGHPIAAVHARSVLRPGVPMMRVSAGRAIGVHERLAHPIAMTVVHHRLVAPGHVTTHPVVVPHVSVMHHVVHPSTIVHHAVVHHTIVHHHVTTVHHVTTHHVIHHTAPVIHHTPVVHHTVPVHTAPALRTTTPPKNNGPQPH